MRNFSLNNVNISIIGLGYVGLPLAVEFGKYFNVIGFDVNKERIRQLKNRVDKTNEIKKKYLSNLKKLSFTCDYKDISHSNVYIVTVPTPINKFNKPDFTNLIHATQNVGLVLKKNDIFILESTVYPGVTEEVCVPILEKKSNLIYNVDFFCGYSPERINPGKSKHKLTNIRKIVSGSNKKILEFVDSIYSKIIKAGTYKVSSIRIAEAAKVIENCQRDINVAFVNELSMIFNKIGIDTQEVLKAASTKWNFLNFSPGLVGGHCIGVDPFYLTYAANKAGYRSKIILAGRKLNLGMSQFVISKLINKYKEKKIKLINSKVLLMGFSFKENCNDIRNTKIIDMYNSLNKKKCLVEIFDPIVNKNDCLKEYNIKLINYPKYNKYDSIIIAVAHNYFTKLKIKEIKKFGKKECIIFDLKGIFNKKDIDLSL